MSAIWYPWNDPSFSEVSDPGLIGQLDVEAALDEPEGSCFWAPLATFEVRQSRNDGMGPVQLGELEARCQAVLSDSEVLQTANAVARFVPTANTLLVDVSGTAADSSNLSLRLVDSPAGFEIVTNG